MKNLFRRLTVTCSALLLTLSAPSHAASGIEVSSLEFGRFGNIVLYAPAAEPEQVVLFISGDGGWNLGVVDMARELAGLDGAGLATLVVGVDIRHYLKSLEAGQEKCAYPAGDFEALGQFVQKKLGYRQFHRPVLVGYSSGATLAYATLVQAPGDTFAGAISLGFCPDLLLRKSLCKGAGLSFKSDAKLGQIFDPVPHLADPWVALHGDQDQVCSLPSASDFVGKVAGASLVSLPKVGHGFSVPRNWMPQFKEAFARIARPAASTPVPGGTSVADLPLREVAAGQSGDTLAVLLTGDGGWAGLDQELAAALAARGIAVIGWDSLRYYWTPRTPDTAARDLARILAHYQAALKRNKIVLIGYSFGADVLPFLARRLPAELKAHIEKIVLLGPGQRAHFEFKLSDWLGGTDVGLDTRGEVAQLSDIPLLCVHGSDEHDSLCPGLGVAMEDRITLPGGHHFDGDYAGLAHLILKSLAPAVPASRN